MIPAICLTLVPEETESDNEFNAVPDPKLVMAEQQAHDVVDQSRSVGALPPSDVSATKNSIQAIEGDEVGAVNDVPVQEDGQDDNTEQAKHAPDNRVLEAVESTDLMVTSRPPAVI